MKNALKLQQELGFTAEKMFYRIGEAARLVGVDTPVLRYWETEFDLLRPRKGAAGQRLYTRDEINLLFLIKRLLYDERYTIDGARKRIAELVEREGSRIVMKEVPAVPQRREDVLDMVKQRLRHMLERL